MIPQLNHPWLPQKKVWGGLPLVAELILLVHHALCAAEEIDAAGQNQLPMVPLAAMDLLFWTEPHRFRVRGVLVTAQLAENASFVAELAIELNARHAAVLRVARCDRVLAAKS